MSDSNRQGEYGRAPFRTGRFFCVNGDWFFSTREGVDYGPYASRRSAEAALLNFVRNHSFTHAGRRSGAGYLHDKEPSPDLPTKGHRFYW